MNKKVSIVHKNLECYFANEYLQSYFDCDLSEENRKRIKKHLKECPYCAYDYENLCEIRKKVRFELEKRTQTPKKVLMAKIIECTIAVFAVGLFLFSLGYFFVKLHTFSKVDKPNDEITEYSFR